ncbi:Phosphomannomutase [Terramyces sp. JEL0728]|nr:Phosphomannomutase [Terramyces sp. JEL0728]
MTELYSKDKILKLLEFCKFSRKAFIKLLCLYRFPPAKILFQVHAFLDSQDQLIEKCANDMFLLHNQLKTAKIINLDLFSAIDILTTGKYQQLPLIVKNRYITENTLSETERKQSLSRLEKVIQMKILTEQVLPLAYRKSMEISEGCATFTVPNEYSITLTLVLDEVEWWEIVDLKFYIELEDSVPLRDTQLNYLRSEAQNSLKSQADCFKFKNLNSKLRNYCLRAKTSILYSQGLKLTAGQWENLLAVKNDIDLEFSFWKKGSENPICYILKIACPTPTSSTVVHSGFGLGDNIVNNLVESLEDNLTNQLDLQYSLFLSQNNEMQPVSISELELDGKIAAESILLKVTGYLANNLLTIWKSHVSAVVSCVESVDGSYARLGVEYYKENLVVFEINPRTGHISINLADMINLDTEKSIIFNVINTLESKINNNFNCIKECLTILKLAVILENVESKVLLNGFKLISNPTHFLGLNGMLKLIKPEASLSIYVNSLQLPDCYFVITIAAQCDWQGIESTEDSVPINSSDGGLINQLTPSSVYAGQSGGYPTDEWLDISIDDLHAIHNSSWLQIAFSKVCDKLEEMNIYFQYILPLNQSYSSPVKISTICPPLLLYFNLNTPPTATEQNNNLYIGRKVNYPVFLKIENGPTTDWNTQPQDFNIFHKLHVRIPAELSSYFANATGENKCVINVVESTITVSFRDFDSFAAGCQEQMLKISLLVDLLLSIHECSEELAARGVNILVVNEAKIQIDFSMDNIIFLEWKDNTWEVVLGNEADGMAVIVDSINGFISKKIHPHFWLEYARNVLPPISELNRMKIQLSALYTTDIRLNVNHWDIELFYLNYGLLISINSNTIELSDICGKPAHNTNDSSPLFKDSIIKTTNTTVTREGLISYLSKEFNIPRYEDRIYVPLNQFHNLVTAIEGYIETILALRKFDEYLAAKVSQKKIEVENMRIVIQITNEFAFAYTAHVHGRWTIQVRSKIEIPCANICTLGGDNTQNEVTLRMLLEIPNDLALMSNGQLVEGQNAVFKDTTTGNIFILLQLMKPTNSVYLPFIVDVKTSKLNLWPTPDTLSNLPLFKALVTSGIEKTISQEMRNALAELRKKVVVGFVGGSDLPKQVEQIGDDVLDLFDFSFAENGLTAYRLGAKLESESFIKFLGEERYKRLASFILKYIAELDIPIKRGTFIEFRNGMINVSPIGRNCSHPEREEFERFDKLHNIRSKFVDALKAEFHDYGLVYSIGGQISFDVVPEGWDKTYCLKHIKNENFREIHFFGDKTFKGGNDYEIYTHPDIKGHSVTSPDDTIRILKELFLK